MAVLNEDFLGENAPRFGINPNLPFRIQKRDLLGHLGFPQNHELKRCRARHSRVVRHLVRGYAHRGYPFLIIVSERPMRTLIPPLFFVLGEERVSWRNDFGECSTISWGRMFEEISCFGPLTWLEFSPHLWGDATVAGRCLYFGVARQILELQRGVVPAQLTNRRDLPVYSGETSFFELHTHQYLETIQRLRGLGFREMLPLNLVRWVCKKLQKYSRGFEELVRISPMPTLEFALLESGRFLPIDIDWPTQWSGRGGDPRGCAGDVVAGSKTRRGGEGAVGQNS